MDEQEGAEKHGRNVHLVFEAKPISEFYFGEYLGYIEQAMGEFNQLLGLPTAFRVRTITASGYQSLVAFLFASKLPKFKVNEFVWKIRHSLEPNLKVSSSFSKYEWTKTNERLFAEIQGEVWRNRHDFLDVVRRRMKSGPGDYDY